MPKVKRMQDAFLAESDDLTNGMSRFCFKLSKTLKNNWSKHILNVPPSRRICKHNHVEAKLFFQGKFCRQICLQFLSFKSCWSCLAIGSPGMFTCLKTKCSFNHFQIFQTLDSDNNGFLSFKEFVLGLNVTANGTRYNRKHIHGRLHTFKHFQRGAVEMDVQAV